MQRLATRPDPEAQGDHPRVKRRKGPQGEAQHRRGKGMSISPV
eukprot:CAMPEP_0174375284 /NCGR_PEP_ID=MMETSP0811_2-20130205/114022_1 /TAXON_ID=73025 ORGANISM="Eutreptiella gymnastica-like, Strain CCMP1594" /NCGR_SAMPLE_ID=MMETSP0811_2 /ASSEMBLY_ACC=CAM_ASM_000667 /LENGTH=42 /DNA_ID= /DNA_START= /DNA_END= /DNA_ORIENTATION=